MNGPLEPTSDLRQLSTMHFQMFTAYVQAGFSPAQALALVGDWIRGGIAASQKDDE